MQSWQFNASGSLFSIGSGLEFWDCTHGFWGSGGSVESSRSGDIGLLKGYIGVYYVGVLFSGVRPEGYGLGPFHIRMTGRTWLLCVLVIVAPLGVDSRLLVGISSI